MAATRGRRVATWAAGIAVVVLVGTGFALKDRLREEYWIWRLRHDDSEWDRVMAARRLGELRSLRAVPEILRAYERLLPIRGAGYVSPLEMEVALTRVGEPALPVLTSALASESGSSRHVAARVIPWILKGKHERTALLVGRLADLDHTNAKMLKALGEDEELPASVRVAAVSALTKIRFEHASPR